MSKLRWIRAGCVLVLSLGMGAVATEQGEKSEGRALTSCGKSWSSPRDCSRA